jgi:hypothetical protein
MNQRIKQLAKQTGYIWHASGDPQIYEFTPEKLEKFAELIVRECADKAHEFIIEDGDEFPLQAVSYRIKQHFGVEE